MKTLNYPNGENVNFMLYMVKNYDLIMILI